MGATASPRYAGEHYQVDGAICRPTPLQDGGIPLWIAGGGEKKTLRIAAQHAEYTNFDGSLEGFKHKSQVLEGHCRELGRDFDEIVRSANYNVVHRARRGRGRDRLRGVRGRDYGPPVGRAAGGRRCSSTRDRPARRHARADRRAARGAAEAAGMTYAIANFHEAAYDDSGIRLFAEQVMPALT